ncbi:MAG: DsbA family protein [archaeon]
MDKMKLLIILVGITLVLTLVNTVVIASFGMVTLPAQNDTSKTGDPNNDSGNLMPPTGSKNTISVDDDSFIGNAEAPVTIVEFSDFQCPYCGKFYNETLAMLKKEYLDTGKAKLVYRDFPLSFHADAQKAAEAAECAGEQGKYFEMHDKIFENQSSIGVENLKQYAVDIGLDSSAFNTCLDSGTMAQEVQKDISDGQAYGVSGTPTFFVNGQKVVGAQPFTVFKQLIDAELAG